MVPTAQSCFEDWVYGKKVLGINAAASASPTYKQQRRTPAKVLKVLNKG